MGSDAMLTIIFQQVLQIRRSPFFARGVKRSEQ